MIKRLIAIMTCNKRGYLAKAQAQRDTWVQQVRAQGDDVLFFYGREAGGEMYGYPDQVILDAPDDYAGIPLKVQAICKYAVLAGYDFVSKCDDDVYVVAGRYGEHSFKGTDYAGRFRGPCGAYPAHFASGFFYTLSRKAAMRVAEAKWNGDWIDERFVANTLAHHGIFGHTDPLRYMVTGPFHPPADLMNQTPTQRRGMAYCQYGAADMHEMHRYFSDAPLLGKNVYVPAPRMAVTAAQLALPPQDAIPPEKLCG